MREPLCNDKRRYGFACDAIVKSYEERERFVLRITSTPLAYRNHQAQQPQLIGLQTVGTWEVNADGARYVEDNYCCIVVLAVRRSVRA
jgi:hypothetical protein